jgi:valyl-tRNA synthetase
MSEIPKAYEPQSVEDKWYDFWLKQNCFTADPKSSKPAYSIVIPPPNVTGVLTMGHVLNNTIQDILARKARMDGKEVLWLPGTDHAGIATQTVVEKTLKKAGEIRHRDDLGREKFLERVWQWKEKHGGIIIQQLKKLGASCDWTRERFTMDPEYSRCVQKVFVELYKKGLIYRGKRMVNWCPASLTALSDEEVIMKEQKGSLYYFKVEVVDKPGSAGVSPASSQTTQHAAGTAALPGQDGKIWLTVATTRPETIPGDTAVAVNPKDPRYAHLIGKHVIRPLPSEFPREQKLIPIIGDEHVDFAFGTGVLKVTPAHDKADFEIGQRHKLGQIEVISANGHMNDLAGVDLKGLDRFKARKVAMEKLTELGSLEKEEPYTNNVGFSERADVPIEPRLSEQWFLKYPSVEKSHACVEQAEAGGASSTSPTSSKGAADLHPPKDGKMRFHPQRWAKVYDHWMGGIQDWCISRQLWWGHRIPVWYNRTDQALLEKTVSILPIPRDTLPGRNIKELRESAWKWAEEHGLIGRQIYNQDTGWQIEVRKASLEHSFSNYGVGVVKIVPCLVKLLEQAVRVASQPHEPPVPDWVSVHTLVSAYTVEEKLHRAKFTIKERADGRFLYDHQTAEVIKNEADGNWSPAPHPGEGKLGLRPTSASVIKIRQLFPDVNKLHRRCQIESPGDGWVQDPDVLDTWFSSWLWPFATMGWPEQTPTLKAFYPTTDLVTGPDIIFFWVARMIMAGYEFMGDLPFRNVYFTGIIRDKQGRKMSKSLGNSPDPLDLIAKFGADALRFGTMRSAPLGQDILFDEQNVELGRNFCNKLWNACRFRQMVGGTGVSPVVSGVSPETFEVQGEIDPKLLTSDDKWILLKLDQAIREMNTAFAEYKFSDATATLYRFFWSEYCDWYVEASKAVLSGSSRRESAQTSGTGADSQSGLTSAATDPKTANTLAVIDFVLSHMLRLFHPFLPFITEELWHGMGYADDMPENQGGQTIMFAPWPKPLDDDFKSHYGLTEGDEKHIEARNELVTQGRNLRRTANIAANKKIKFILKPARELAAHDVEVLKLLLNAETVEANANYQPGKNTMTVRAELGDLFLPLEGLIDKEAETARLKKELEKIEAEAAKVEQKLANPNFAQKVPANVLEEHKQRLTEWHSKRDHVKAALAALQG